MFVPGVDLSRHRRVKSWEKLAAGVRFVLTKATDGTAWVDPSFLDNWFNCPLWGLLRGAFHYYQPRLDPERQALHFHSTVTNAGAAGMLPPLVDFEEDDAQASHFKAFLDAAESLFGCRLGIYTSLRYWFATPPSWTNNYPLWVASWRRSAPTLPRGWATWQYWQYSNVGDGYGLGIDNRTVDVDHFNGDYASLLALTGGAPAPPPSVAAARVRSAWLNLRVAPWGAEVGRAFRGSAWEVRKTSFDAAGRPWYWINERACLAGWQCEAV